MPTPARRPAAVMEAVLTGHDEVGDPGTRLRVVRAIEAWTREYPGRCWVTTRNNAGQPRVGPRTATPTGIYLAVQPHLHAFPDLPRPLRQAASVIRPADGGADLTAPTAWSYARG